MEPQKRIFFKKKKQKDSFYTLIYFNSSCYKPMQNVANQFSSQEKSNLQFNIYGFAVEKEHHSK